MRGKRSHKGKSRCFTSPEEIDRQLGRSKSPNGDEEPVASTSELPITVPEESDSDGDEMRHKGISHLIEVYNPNLDEKTAKEGPSRKEAEAAARAVADPLSLKSEAELASDLARLALVRKEREQAALKLEQEKQAREAAREAAAQRAQAKLQSLKQKGGKPGQKRSTAPVAKKTATKPTLVTSQLE
ncbi:hypothetical protein CSKR_108378 [Clonorchis sinensis]|uniref:Heat-and acid-stable phosphoprotein n=1 Tax=Clonorchis sinensis TaxID=79923 RepID=A0A8T1N0X1_CLOSI|nr:hypothetical protein CSKR_108378 [Clonorchis sinensis]